MHEWIEEKLETTYQCEICGKTSFYKEYIEYCEKQCKCKHTYKRYKFTYGTISESRHFVQYCGDCEKHLKYIG